MPGLVSARSERLDRGRGGPEAAGARHRPEGSGQGALHADRPGPPPGAGFHRPGVSIQAS